MYNKVSGNWNKCWNMKCNKQVSMHFMPLILYLSCAFYSNSQKECMRTTFYGGEPLNLNIPLDRGIHMFTAWLSQAQAWFITHKIESQLFKWPNPMANVTPTRLIFKLKICQWGEVMVHPFASQKQNPTSKTSKKFNGIQGVSRDTGPFLYQNYKICDIDITTISILGLLKSTNDWMSLRSAY